MVGVDDIGQQAFGLNDQLLIQTVLLACDHQLFDQHRQALGKRNFRGFRVLILVIMEQLQNERELLEGVFLGARRVRGCLAALNPLVERL